MVAWALRGVFHQLGLGATGHPKIALTRPGFANLVSGDSFLLFFERISFRLGSGGLLCAGDGLSGTGARSTTMVSTSSSKSAQIPTLASLLFLLESWRGDLGLLNAFDRTLSTLPILFRERRRG
jgi:hypothetical protein